MRGTRMSSSLWAKEQQSPYQQWLTLSGQVVQNFILQRSLLQRCSTLLCAIWHQSPRTQDSPFQTRRQIQVLRRSTGLLRSLQEWQKAHLLWLCFSLFWQGQILNTARLRWKSRQGDFSVVQSPFFLTSDLLIQIMQKDKKKSLFVSPSLEHMLFPVPPKLNLQAILLLMPSLSFQLNYTLAKHKQVMKKAFSNELEALWWIAKSQNDKVEPRVVAVLLFLQLVNSRHDITGFNESFKVQQNSYSPMSSPRTRSNRTLFVSQQIQIFQFIKENLRVFLKLISSDPTSDMINITQAEFNHLSILFRFSGASFAQSSGLFGPSPRLPLGNLVQHLSMKMASSQSQLHHISNLSECITVKKQDCSGHDIRIVSCVQSYIYLDAAVGSVHILNCENCTVLVAASARIVYVDKCVNMKITVACPVLRVCNSIDSVFNCFTICPPIFTGDNRALIVGPYNAPLKNLQLYFKETGMSLSGKSPGTDSPLCMPADVQMYSVMQPQDFQALVLPEDNQYDIERLVLIPMNFKKQLKERQSLIQELTKTILESGMNLTQMKVLNAHIQGHFREWLRSSGQIKPISDLIKPIN